MRLPDRDADSGSAIVEFVFVAIVIMVPLMYLIVVVAQVQRNQLAVSQAARDAGRAFATSTTPAQAATRVDAAVRLAFADQGLPDDATVRFVAAGAGCGSGVITPRLAAGAQFAVCVTRRAHLPGVPSVLSGRGVTMTSEFVVHVDDFRYFAS
ncbi:TadE/TadG family type IV pilus assembly protein [Jatrophihabitans endophyticus]|uniref:TadE/TadG family type IV pilus assembly protein n=1 Tax=Jatrophihabitans endophyticus TaxID=1206085 RepID=UPI0019F84A93|nr:TadE/TadG family type IV pilus assembly protein [Jatrophihabitans endophyticus]MBE7186982.1 pilus assembly protein [Jatrophihabitans endophyticus]